MAENENQQGQQGEGQETGTAATTSQEQTSTTAAPPPPQKSVVVYGGDDEATLLQQRDEVERAIQLGARQDPDKVTLPWGEKLTDYRRRMEEQHREEGREALEQNENRVRLTSRTAEPIYREGTAVRFDESGASALIEPKVEEPVAPAPAKTEEAK